MENVFLIFFITGVLFVLLSFLLGGLFHMHHLHLHWHVHVGGTDMPVLSPTTIAAFITVFGGIGYLLEKVTNLTQLIVLMIAIVIGFIAAVAMFFAVMVPLYKAEKTNALPREEAVGTIARAITSIPEKGRGEIIYEQGGSRHNAPAQSFEGVAIPNGAKVVIVEVKEGEFYVSQLN